MSPSARPAPPRPWLALLAALTVSSALFTPARAHAATPSASGDLAVEVVEKIDSAKEAMSRHDYQAAIRDLKSADKLAGGQCAVCQIGLAKAYNGAGAYKEVAKTLEKALAATDDPQLLGLAWNEQGLALAAAAGSEKPDMDKLAAAEAAFRKAIAYSQGGQPQLNLGVVLLRMSKDEEGKAELEKFLAANPNSPNAAMARDMIANPLRARKRIFPDVDFVTLTGDYISAADLRGKVVLIDFWGTWCPPCRAAVPSLKNLAHRQAKNPFLLVSVSSDADEAVLKDYVAKNEMTWPQVFDQKHEIIRRCNIDSYPTYLLLDPDGAIVYSASGWGDAIEYEIETRIGRAVRAAEKAKH